MNAAKFNFKNYMGTPIKFMYIKGEISQKGFISLILFNCPGDKKILKSIHVVYGLLIAYAIYLVWKTTAGYEILQNCLIHEVLEYL